MRPQMAAQVARAQEILAERHTDGTRLDRETLALRIAALEQRESAVSALVEAVKARATMSDFVTREEAAELFPGPEPEGHKVVVYQPIPIIDPRTVAAQLVDWSRRNLNEED